MSACTGAEGEQAALAQLWDILQQAEAALISQQSCAASSARMKHSTVCTGAEGEQAALAQLWDILQQAEAALSSSFPGTCHSLDLTIMPVSHHVHLSIINACHRLLSSSLPAPAQHVHLSLHWIFCGITCSRLRLHSAAASQVLVTASSLLIM